MLTYPLDPAQKKPLYEQLYGLIRRDIEQGRLSPGEKLPSKRQLAAHLRVGVVTVEGAYEQLVAEGYICPQPKRGYYVQAIETAPLAGVAPQDVSAPLARVASPAGAPPPPEAAPLTTPTPRSATGPEAGAPAAPGGEYDFRTNAVDTSYFPFSTWARLTREVLAEGDARLLAAVDPQGALPLRQAIVRHLRQFRGVEAAPEQIVVGAGAEYLTGLLVQLLGREGAYAVENPGYPRVYQILEKNGARAAPTALDGQGLRVDALERSGARVVHVSPSHHFPLGTVMPYARRAQLLAWAASGPDRIIIEDDYDSEFRYAGRPIPALQGMDRGGRVIYLNTFAKSLAPSLRIGYLVLPPRLLERYRREFLFYSSTVPSFEQYTLARFMERGHFERHLSRMRTRYKARRDALAAAVKASALASRLTLEGTEAGQHALMRVRGPLGERELTRRALARGVRLTGLSAYYAAGTAQEGGPPGLVLGYAQRKPEDMAPALRRLEAAWL